MSKHSKHVFQDTALAFIVDTIRSGMIAGQTIFTFAPKYVRLEH